MQCCQHHTPAPEPNKPELHFILLGFNKITLGSTGARFTAFMPFLAGVPGSSLTLMPLAACVSSLFFAHCKQGRKEMQQG